MVFADYDDMAARIDDPDLAVDDDSVLVLQNAGPLGAPGMPEWGQLPIPKKLLEHGRARHGAHLRRAHERHQLRRLRAARRARVRVGGPLALVRDGDVIELDVAGPHARRCTSARPSWRRGGRPGAAPTPKYARLRRAVLPRTSRRPTRAATSTSSQAPPTPEPEIH